MRSVALSNKATWSDSIIVRDADTREPIDLTDATEVTVKLRERGREDAALSVSLTGGGVTREESTGILSFVFTASQMATLCPATYEIGILITFPDTVEQAVLSRVAILKGL